MVTSEVQSNAMINNTKNRWLFQIARALIMNIVDLVQNLIFKQEACSQDNFSNCPFPIFQTQSSVERGGVFTNCLFDLLDPT